jgi:hypothetical protein
MWGEPVQTKRQQDALRKVLAEDARDWLAGRTNLIRDGRVAQRTGLSYPDVLLRVRPQGKETAWGSRWPKPKGVRGSEFVEDNTPQVETSAGNITLPLVRVKRIYAKLQADKLRRATPEGVQIACHFITRAEFARFARTQGW